MGITSRTLRDNGLDDAAKEMCERIRGSGNYYKALGIIGEYVNITSVDEQEHESEPDMGMKMYRRYPSIQAIHNFTTRER